jgi:hypothetical protein
MEKLPHYYAPWMVSFKKQRHIRDASSGHKTIRRLTVAPFVSREPSPLQTTIDQKLLENLEYFKYMGSMITNDARCTSEIKSIIVTARASFSRKKKLFSSKLNLNLRNKQLKRYISSTELYGAETWTHRKVHQNYL